MVATAGAYADRRRSCPLERDQEPDVGLDQEVSAVKGLAIPKAWAHRGSNKSDVVASFKIPKQYYAPMSHVPVWSDVKRSESGSATTHVLRQPTYEN